MSFRQERVQQNRPVGCRTHAVQFFGSLWSGNTYRRSPSVGGGQARIGRSERGILQRHSLKTADHFRVAREKLGCGGTCLEIKVISLLVDLISPPASSQF